jgi:hypothetical protein
MREVDYLTKTLIGGEDMKNSLNGETPTQHRIAMLIDGDNAQPKLIEKMIRETEKYGTITIRRIYGDWTTQNMGGWKPTLHVHAIQPIQQFCYTTGKNATDSALIIEAMDILHEGTVQGFCIVSSDSDFTRLATRIREEGSFVIGIGEKKTPKAFVKSCDIFVYTENIIGETILPSFKGKTKAQVKKTMTKIDPKLKKLLIDAYDNAVQEDEWAHLSRLGESLRKIDPGFDPRTYGHRQLSKLIKAYPNLFDIVQRDKNVTASIYVKLKQS